MTLWSRRRRRAHRARVALNLAVIEAFRAGFIKQRCTVRFFDDFTVLA